MKRVKTRTSPVRLRRGSGGGASRGAVLASRRRRLILGGGGAPTGPITELNLGLDVQQVTGTIVGTTNGAIDITPEGTTGIFEGGGTINDFTVQNNGTVIFSGDFLESDFSWIEISVDGYSANPIRLVSDSSSVFTQYTITGETDFYTFLDALVGTTANFTLSVPGSLEELGTNEHWLIPNQTTSTYRGYNIAAFGGTTYDSGHLARIKFTEPNTAHITQLACSSAGLLYIDCNFSPSPTTPGPTIEFEGYNWDSPIQLAAWNGFDFRKTGETAVYTYLGTQIDSLIKVRIIGPGV